MDVLTLTIIKLNVLLHVEAMRNITHQKFKVYFYFTLMRTGEKTYL